MQRITFDFKVLYFDELSRVILCFHPQENINNPLYMEEVKVVDELTRSANIPAPVNEVGFTLITYLMSHQRIYISNNEKGFILKYHTTLKKMQRKKYLLLHNKSYWVFFINYLLRVKPQRVLFCSGLIFL